MIEIKAIYALQIIRRTKKSTRMQMQSHSNISILCADTFCHMKVREFEGLMRKFLIISLKVVGFDNFNMFYTLISIKYLVSTIESVLI